MSRKRSRGVLGNQRVGGGKTAQVTSKVVDRLATVIALSIVFLLVAVIGIVVVGFGNKAYNYVLSQDRLIVKDIDVDGTVVLTPDEIIQLSGIKKNQPILKIDLQKIAQKIKANPRIADVAVERHLPRKVLIKIKERVPIGLVKIGGEMKGIDAEGTIVPLITSREDVKAPIITEIENAGDSKELIQEALEVIRLLRPDLVSRISEIRLDSNTGLTLLTVGTPVVIRMGRGDMEAKIERLRRAMKLFDSRGETKEYIDVRFKEIVTRP